MKFTGNYFIDFIIHDYAPDFATVGVLVSDYDNYLTATEVYSVDIPIDDNTNVTEKAIDIVESYTETHKTLSETGFYTID